MAQNNLVHHILSDFGFPVFRTLESGSVLFVEGFALPLAFNLALLFGCVFDIVRCGGSIGGNDSCGVALLGYEFWSLTVWRAGTHQRMFLLKRPRKLGTGR